jgi:membrane protease YdiL (CAAX protease family)
VGALFPRALPLRRITIPRTVFAAAVAAGATAFWVVSFGWASRLCALWIPSEELRRLVVLLGFAAVEIASLALVAWMVLREPIRSLLPGRAGLSRWLLRGIGIGVIANGFPPAVLTFMDKGWIVPHPPMSRAAALAAVLSLPLGVLWEEVVYRGAILRWLRPLGLLPALGISSALFAALHFLAEPFGATRLVLLFALGVLFGVAYRAASSLWFPIGIHLGLNFVGFVLASDPLAGGIWRFKIDADPVTLLGISLAGVGLAAYLAAALPRALRGRDVSFP